MGSEEMCRVWRSPGRGETGVLMGSTRIEKRIPGDGKTWESEEEPRAHRGLTSFGSPALRPGHVDGQKSTRSPMLSEEQDFLDAPHEVGRKCVKT